MFYNLLKPYITHSKKRTFKRGEPIYHQGDQPQELYLVDSGLVGLFHLSESGKETFLRVFKKDSIFGHRSYFAESPYHGTAIALSKCEISVITQDQCVDICVNKPELLKKMTKMLAQDLGEAELRLAGLLDKTANQRIAEALIYLKFKYPEQTWTRKEIAEFSGSTFETVARVMSLLSENNLLEKNGRDYTISNPDKVLDFISE